jgi:glycerol kinase
MKTLMQLQATNSRVEVARSRCLEATARGAASVAGLEIGVWHSLEQLGELWEPDLRFSPQDPTFADLSYRAWLRACERT